MDRITTPHKHSSLIPTHKRKKLINLLNIILLLLLLYVRLDGDVTFILGFFSL